jgi:hypothetical protein
MASPSHRQARILRRLAIRRMCKRVRATQARCRPIAIFQTSHPEPKP